MLIDDLSEIKEGSFPSADESIEVVRNLKREMKEDERKQQAPVNTMLKQIKSAPN